KPGDLLVKMEDADAAARLASANSTLSAAELNQQNLKQNGSQEERLALAADLSRAEIRQNQAKSDLAALRQLQQKGAASPAEVADLNRIQVRAYFDEPEIGRLAVGQSVKIVWDAKPNQTWHGHISRAPSTVITYGTRNVGECIITVDDARGDLLPNTNVTVTV